MNAVVVVKVTAVVIAADMPDTLSGAIKPRPNKSQNWKITSMI
jgi:hypothetical protein